MKAAGAVLQKADLSNARYYGGTSTSAVPAWCGRLGGPASSTLPGCSCHGGGDHTLVPLPRCDGDCELWNAGDDVDEARDVVDYAGDGQRPPHRDAIARRFLAPRPETTGLLGDLNDNMTSSRDFPPHRRGLRDDVMGVTSSRDFLVATDAAIGRRHVGNRDNNNDDDVYDDGDDDD